MSTCRLVYPPIADIARRGWHGRKVPGADSCTAANSILFDHFIGQREQREWPVRSRNLTPQMPWCGQCINDQSSVMPTDLTSALHRTISDLSSVPSSSGEDPPAA
jgi:hypothetical protein